jgi:hypothetical protein
MLPLFLFALKNSILAILLTILIGLVLYGLKMLIFHILCTFFGAKAGMFIVNRLTFPGTVHHELSHALFAFVTGAKVTNIQLLTFHGSELGSVKFKPRGNAFLQSIQLCFASLAPVIMGIISLYLMVTMLNPRFTAPQWQYFVLIYLEISIFLHMTLSGKDISAALKGLPGLLLILILIFYLTRFDLFSHLKMMLSGVVPQVFMTNDFIYAIKGLLKMVQ